MLQRLTTSILIYLFISFTFQDICAQPLRSFQSDPDTTVTMRDLMAPSFQHINLNLQLESSLNPFPPQKKIPVPILFNLGSAIIKSTVDEPFHLPNYGLGLPPSIRSIRPKSVTDYELLLRRINRY